MWVVLAGLEQADPEGLTEAWLTTYLWQARSEVYRNGVLQLYMTHVLDFVRRKGPVNINDEFVTSKLWFGGYRADQGPREAADGVRFSIQLAAQASVDYDLQIRIWVDGPGGVVYAKEIFATIARGGARLLGRLATSMKYARRSGSRPKLRRANIRHISYSSDPTETGCRFRASLTIFRFPARTL